MEHSKFQHGGNIFEIAKQNHVPPQEILDLSSNLSPATPTVVHLLTKNQDFLSYLPEVYSNSLKNKLSTFYQIASDELIIGAGTTELIQWICYCFQRKKILIPQPTYADYQKYAEAFECEIQLFSIEQSLNKFTIFLEKFIQQAKTVDVTFLCNPNNPTGSVLSKNKIRKILTSCPNTLVIIDESYLPFLPDEQDYSMLKENYPNLVVLRSMSKIFALPGLRTGWLFTKNQFILKKIQQVISPWSVNSLAQKIAEELFGYEYKTIAIQIQNTKTIFLEKIKQFISWLTPFESSANFVLFACQKFTAQEIYSHCAQYNLLIRDCSNFYPLTNQFIRIAIKSPENMDYAIQVLQKLDQK
ncbi:MAG: threonine-phosphate decarboxylase [bacterium]|jgi:threonine-phosphate decarboxylase